MFLANGMIEFTLGVVLSLGMEMASYDNYGLGFPADSLASLARRGSSLHLKPTRHN